MDDANNPKKTSQKEEPNSNKVEGESSTSDTVQFSAENVLEERRLKREASFVSDESYHSAEEELVNLDFGNDSDLSSSSSSSSDSGSEIEISIGEDVKTKELHSNPEETKKESSSNAKKSTAAPSETVQQVQEGTSSMASASSASNQVEEGDTQASGQGKTEAENAVPSAPSKPKSGHRSSSDPDIGDLLGSGGLDLGDMLGRGRLDFGDMLRMMLRGGIERAMSSRSDGEKKLKRAVSIFKHNIYLIQKVEGIRVVRGPDWSWRDQDKGEGQVGTVRIMKDKEGVVQVAWDYGDTNDYSAGYKGKHDLRIFDIAQVGVRHSSVTCDECREKGVWGIRWKCHVCPDFDLCTKCYMTDKHMEHVFRRILKPGSPSVLLSTREGSRKVKAQGLFANAKVCRGEDWKYPNQDGGPGCHGIIAGIEDWEFSAERNCAAVNWDIGRSNKYRVGYHGYCDLRYVEPATWGNYYPLHLPSLDIADLIDEGSGDSASGDRQDHDNLKVEIVSGISGTRVIRGKDWQWDSQDNGPFNMGTVEGIYSEKSDLDTCVFWDHGFRAQYRSGAKGKFDLKIVDNAPAKVIHRGVKCDSCGEDPLRGLRWKCLTCSTVNLCTECYGEEKHNLSHSFGRLLNPDSGSEFVKVPPRLGAHREQLQGIFKGATVVRGPDWRWGEQDGKAGTSGTVMKPNVPEEHEDAGHCWFFVKWQGKERANAYRLGIDGCIDMKALKPADGYYVYPDHLPDFTTPQYSGKFGSTDSTNLVASETESNANDARKDDNGEAVEEESESIDVQASLNIVFPLQIEGSCDKFRIHRPDESDDDSETHVDEKQEDTYQKTQSHSANQRQTGSMGSKQEPESFGDSSVTKPTASDETKHAKSSASPSNAGNSSGTQESNSAARQSGQDERTHVLTTRSRSRSESPRTSLAALFSSFLASLSADLSAAGDEGKINMKRIPKIKAKLQHAENQCTICMESIKVGELLLQVPGCNCIYHQECLGHWFKDHTRCPNCAQAHEELQQE